MFQLLVLCIERFIGWRKSTPAPRRTAIMGYNSDTSDAAVFDALGAEVEQRMTRTARELDSLEGVTLNDLAGVPRE
jgi:hypothetical protein